MGRTGTGRSIFNRPGVSGGLRRDWARLGFLHLLKRSLARAQVAGPGRQGLAVVQASGLPRLAAGRVRAGWKPAPLRPARIAGKKLRCARRDLGAIFGLAAPGRRRFNLAVNTERRPMDRVKAVVHGVKRIGRLVAKAVK
jgi:hypothetical protein